MSQCDWFENIFLSLTYQITICNSSSPTFPHWQKKKTSNATVCWICFNGASWVIFHGFVIHLLRLDLLNKARVGATNSPASNLPLNRTTFEIKLNIGMRRHASSPNLFDEIAPSLRSSLTLKVSWPRTMCVFLHVAPGMKSSDTPGLMRRPHHCHLHTDLPVDLNLHVAIACEQILQFYSRHQLRNLELAVFQQGTEAVDSGVLTLISAASHLAKSFRDGN